MNKKTKKTGQTTRTYEIAGLILFVLSVFAVLSLVPRADNLCGPIGLRVSHISKRVCGLSAFVIPIVLFVMSLKLFLRQEIRDLVYSFSGYIVLLISLSGLLSLIGKTTSVSVLGPNTGGVLGVLIAGGILRSLSQTGAYLALFMIFLLALMLATGLSIAGLSKGIGAIFLSVFNRIGSTISDYRQKRKSARQISRTDSAVEPASAIPKPKKSVLKEEKVLGSKDTFRLPPISILNTPDKKQTQIDKDKLVANSRLLQEKLRDYGVEGKVMGVCPGPVITMYEFEPGPGVKINKIMGLSDDLALALKALSIRIVAPVPGKSVVGIEIANQKRLSVVLRDVLASDVFASSQSKLTIALGREIMGKPVVTDLAKMPHLLIAGATGTGKSVAINSMICSMLMKATPDEVRLLMIDPKRIELAPYEGIPHLLHPVVMDPKKATLALRWTVQEMSRRYELLAEVGARNIDAYNEIIKKKAAKSGSGPHEIQHEKLPYVVVVIDELADLMMISSKDVEDSITRLAQMARAAGIHLILATQRPSVDVLTGVIKANFPTRISFQVSSKVDSRTILDTIGAERLLGSGDMLFLPPGTSKIVRIHGAYISDAEITKIADFLKKQKRPIYDESIVETTPEEMSKEDIHDEKYEDAVKLVWETKQASISMIQRRLRIGYNRAARIIEHMEREGIVGPSDGVKPREVLMRRL